MLSKFYENTYYSDTSDFEDYKLRVSNLLSSHINRAVISINNGYFGKWNTDTETHLVVLRTKDLRYRESYDIPEEDDFKKYYDTPNIADFKEFVANEIVKQISSIRLDKDTKQYLVSKYDCHIEIVIALNYLAEVTDYLFRCLGSRQVNLYYSDIMEVETRLNVVPLIIKRIKNIK